MEAAPLRKAFSLSLFFQSALFSCVNYLNQSGSLPAVSQVPQCLSQTTITNAEQCLPSESQ